MPGHEAKQNGKPSRRNASPRGLARPKACVGVTRWDRVAAAMDVEPCRCPLVPVVRASDGKADVIRALHDLLRKINGDEWDDEVRSGAWEEPRKRRTQPLPPEYRLTAWVMGIEPCHHARSRRLKRPGDVQAWLDLVALWADVLRRSDPRGYRDRPEPRPEALPPSPAARVEVRDNGDGTTTPIGVYARRAAAGKSLFSKHDTVRVPLEDLPRVDAGDAARMDRDATLAEARARGAARREGWHMGGEGE